MTSFQASSPMRRSKVSLVTPALATRTSTGPEGLLHRGEGRLDLGGVPDVAGHREEVHGVGPSPASSAGGAVR